MRRHDKDLSVLVCRGCSCGSYFKHPDIDHATHLAALTGAVQEVPGARIYTVECLDACERSNVVVVRSEGRRRWFGQMLADRDVRILAQWLQAGGHGDTPIDLRGHLFDPDRFTPPTLPMAHLAEAELLDWIIESLAGGGTWTSLVDGAPIEFPGVTLGAGDPAVEIVRTNQGGTITARTPAGALVLTVVADTRAFLVDTDQPPADTTASIPAFVLASVSADDHPTGLPHADELPKGFRATAAYVKPA